YSCRVRRVEGTVVLLLTAAVLGGCGGKYTKQDFVARANAICDSTVRDTRRIPPPSFTGSAPQRLEALAGYVGPVLPIARSEEAKRRDLKRPPGTPGELRLLDRYYAALGKSVASYRDLQTAAQNGDAAGVTAAVAALRANPVATLATRYGIRSCGVPGTT